MIGNLVADILFKKGKSQLIVVEVKKGNLERGVGEQVLGYRLALKAIEPNKKVKCVVVANYAKPEYKKVLEKWRIEVIELSDEYLKDLIKNHGTKKSDSFAHCIYHQDKKMLLEYASTDMKLKCCLASCDYKLPYTLDFFDLSIADASIDSYLKHLKINREDSRIIQRLPLLARAASLASCFKSHDRERENTDKSGREAELDRVKQDVKRYDDIITVLEPFATKTHLCSAYEALTDLYYEKIYDLEGMFYIADFDKNLVLHFVKAAEHFKKAIDSKPDEALFHADLGYALLLKGDQTESQTHLQKAVELYPEFFKPNYYMGYLSYKQHDYGTALSYLKQADKLVGGNPEIRLMIGESLEQSGDVRSAVEYYVDVYQADPQSKAGQIAMKHLLRLGVLKPQPQQSQQR